MSIASKWKKLKAGVELPVSLRDVDRLEQHFGGSPNSDTADAKLFWENAILRPRTTTGVVTEFTHTLRLRSSP